MNVTAILIPIDSNRSFWFSTLLQCVSCWPGLVRVGEGLRRLPEFLFKAVFKGQSAVKGKPGAQVQAVKPTVGSLFQAAGKKLEEADCLFRDQELLSSRQIFHVVKFSGLTPNCLVRCKKSQPAAVASASVLRCQTVTPVFPRTF